MDTYVINLKRRTDRLKRFKFGSDLAKVDVKVVEAFDGKELSMKDYWLGKYDNLDKMRYLMKGEIGAYLSHYKCLELSGSDRVLIFEDDAKIPYDFWYGLNKLLKTLPEDFDIALLGTTRLWQRKYKQRCKKIWENEDWARYEGDIYGTQAYIITRKAVEHMIDCKYPIISPFDVKVNQCGLKLYVVKEDLVGTNRLGSDAQRT